LKDRQEKLSRALALWRLPRVGPKTFNKLYCIDNTFHVFFQDRNFSSELYKRLPSLVGQSPDWRGVDQDLRWLETAGQRVLLMDDLEYPAWLQHIDDKPPLLFVKGNVACLSEPQLAIVGSRRPSYSGLELAFKMARGLSEHDLYMTSGLALGIDGAAHRGAIAAKKPTIAVLGCGIDIVYPKRHQELAEQIVQNAGALVSEYPTGVPPLAEHFPRRNRIISGLSMGTLVVEAALKSGSLITADCALQQGREVFAIPGSILSLNSEGCHYLIQQGAKLVVKVQDILEELRWEKKSSYQGEEASPLLPSETLMGEQRAVCQAVERLCTSTDLVIDRTKLSTRTVNRVLLELILMGAIDAVPGGYIRKSGGMP
jgi:DNA processing protein